VRSGTILLTNGLQTNLLVCQAEQPYILLIGALDSHWGKRMMGLSDDWTRPAELATLPAFFEHIRPTDELTPSPGFYERVRNRIEQIERQSIWIPFIYSGFPIRIAISFLALSLAAFWCVVAAEWNANGAERTLNGEVSDAIFNPTDLQQQRDAVLMQFAAYRQPN